MDHRAFEIQIYEQTGRDCFPSPPSERSREEEFARLWERGSVSVPGRQRFSRQVLPKPVLHGWWVWGPLGLSQGIVKESEWQGRKSLPVHLQVTLHSSEHLGEGLTCLESTLQFSVIAHIFWFVLHGNSGGSTGSGISLLNRWNPLVSSEEVRALPQGLRQLRDGAWAGPSKGGGGGGRTCRQ